MMGYDVAIGKVQGGMGSLEDHQTVGLQLPDRDASQDWMLTYFSENNGTTKLKFYRKLNTNDEKDVVIQQGMSIYIVWAYSPTNDTLGQHAGNNRGSQQVTLVPAGVTPTTPTPTAAVATVSMPAMPVQPIFLNLQNENYKVSWIYNSSMDTIHFTVEVRATGWIAFGVATTAPTGMVGYDVAIGKVEGGIGSLEDHQTVGFQAPDRDASQDWMLTYSSENNGMTKLKFYRKLNTNDEKDVVIQ
ncbi:MOXD1 homolog 2-like, partial [Stylophora pistillata]|uniref:MOXD1 homolog 2-like n=1 Tax=Stylophora pistillata TaxID=50429 RepID=UPI000C04075B